MRITNSMTSNRLLLNVNRSARMVDRLMMQISTQKRIQNPSDDPIIASRAIRFRTNVAEVQQFQRNSQQALAWMSVTEQTLNRMTQGMGRNLGDLLVQGASGTYTFEQRQTITTEISMMMAHLKSELNSTFAGRHVFSGFRTDQPPIVTQTSLNSPDNPVDLHVGMRLNRNDIRRLDSAFWRDQGGNLHKMVSTRLIAEETGMDWLDNDNVTVVNVNIIQLPYHRVYEEDGVTPRRDMTAPVIPGFNVVEMSIYGEQNPYIVPEPGTIHFIPETGELVIHSDDVHDFGINEGRPADEGQLGNPGASTWLRHPLASPDLPVGLEHFYVFVGGDARRVTIPPEVTTVSDLVNHVNELDLGVRAILLDANTMEFEVVELGPIPLRLSLPITTDPRNGTAGGAEIPARQAEAILDGLRFGPDGTLGVSDPVRVHITVGGVVTTIDVPLQSGYTRSDVVNAMNYHLAPHAAAELRGVNVVLISEASGSHVRINTNVSFEAVGVDSIPAGDPGSAVLSLNMFGRFPVEAPPDDGINITVTVNGIDRGPFNIPVGIPNIAAAAAHLNQQLEDANITDFTVSSSGSNMIFRTIATGPDASISVTWSPTRAGEEGWHPVPGRPPTPEVPPSWGNLDISFRLNGLFANELNPRVFFNTTDYSIPGSPRTFINEGQDIQFEFGANVRLTINSHAQNVAPWQLFADFKNFENKINRVQLTDTSDPYLFDDHAREQIAAWERSFFGETLYQMFTHTIENAHGHLDDMTTEFTALGSRMNRIELIYDRLLENHDTFSELMSLNENVDILEVLMRFNAVEAVFQAAMQVGARISQLSLVNFL